MQNGGTGIDDNAAVSATSTEHQPADRNDAVSVQSLPEITLGEEPEALDGKKSKNGRGYEVPDPREVEEARMRDQQPAEYTGLQADTRSEEQGTADGKKSGNGGGY